MTHSQFPADWDDQELHKLFAAHLPTLPMPGDFVTRLTQSVLHEVTRHVESVRATATDNAQDELLGKESNGPAVTAAE
ncbi:MAG: hypothetical protein R2932_57965 [Caldilineaceae bacterium]